MAAGRGHEGRSWPPAPASSAPCSSAPSPSAAAAPGCSTCAAAGVAYAAAPASAGAAASGSAVLSAAPSAASAAASVSGACVSCTWASCSPVRWFHSLHAPEHTSAQVFLFRSNSTVDCVLDGKLSRQPMQRAASEAVEVVGEQPLREPEPCNRGYQDARHCDNYSCACSSTRLTEPSPEAVTSAVAPPSPCTKTAQETNASWPRQKLWISCAPCRHWVADWCYRCHVCRGGSFIVSAALAALEHLHGSMWQVQVHHMCALSIRAHVSRYDWRAPSGVLPAAG